MTRPDPRDLEPGQLPELLARVAEDCGVGTALSFAQAFGGRQLYVPLAESLAKEHPIAAALGLPAARKVVGVLGPGRHMIPMGPTTSWRRQRQAIRRMLLEGEPWNTVAAAAGVHVRTVARVSAQLKLPADPDPGLFG